MKTFMIHCSTTKSYWITVEAPSKEAAELWYEGCDAGEFLSGEEWGWDLAEIQELPSSTSGPPTAAEKRTTLRLRVQGGHKLLNELGEEI